MRNNENENRMVALHSDGAGALAPAAFFDGGRLALREKEAAAAMGISPATLFRIADDPDSGIPCFKLNGVKLYPVRELMDWLADQVKRDAG